MRQIPKMKKIYPEKKKADMKFILAIFTIIVLLVILIGLIYSLSIKKEEKIIALAENNSEGGNRVTLYLPAVNDEKIGVVTKLIVESTEGTGNTLVNIDNVLFWGDTQNSIRIAKKVAQNITNINVDRVNLIYSIEANASVVGGESAGAALTIATIAALENKIPNPRVVITGTINHDGTIGPVGEILEKAKAAKSVNASIFLVPLLQSREIIYETKKHCEKFGNSEYCTEEQIPKKINVSQEAEIQVIEVGTIREAMDYFFEN
jgi:uncharacterized protein